MDVGRLKKKNIEVWFPYVEDAEVLCGHLSQREYDEITAACTERKINRKTGNTEIIRDDKKFRSLLARAVVKDWRGLTDDGADFPCNPENIDYLMEESTEFRLLVQSAPMSLEQMLEAEREAVRKNSGSSSGLDT